jgi:hypothetical protein
VNHLGDTNKKVSDTPRTDTGKKIVLGGVGGDWEVVHIAFSRQLERELNAANDRIKRLEEAGDAMDDYILDQTNTRFIICAIQWREAKEAKL